MISTGTTEISSAVTDLKEKWDKLNDLDRARAINDIKQKEEISTRKLATQLGRAESVLRRIREAAQAPVSDQIRFRGEKISANELLGRSRAAAAERAAKERKALELARTKAAQKGCMEIHAWLKQENLAPVAGVKVVDEARRQLDHAEQRGKHWLRRGSPLERFETQLQVAADVVFWMVFPVPILPRHPEVRIEVSAITIQRRNPHERLDVLCKPVIPSWFFRLQLTTEMPSKHPLCKPVQYRESRIDKEVSVLCGKAVVVPLRHAANLFDQFFH
jgi:hypothetical protein